MRLMVLPYTGVAIKVWTCVTTHGVRDGEKVREREREREGGERG